MVRVADLARPSLCSHFQPPNSPHSAPLRTERALERDHFMTAEEAVKFGIVDKIVRRRPSPSSQGGAAAAVGKGGKSGTSSGASSKI